MGRGFGTVAGVVFLLIAVGTSVYAISSAEDKVTESEKIAGEFAVQGILYRLAGGGPVGMIVTMVAGMYSDNPVLNRQHAEEEVVEAFLRKRVPSAFGKNGEIDPDAFQAAHTLLFKTQPFELSDSPEHNNQPTAGGPAPAARVWRTDNQPPPTRK
jgi:hypothetical protein